MSNSTALPLREVKKARTIRTFLRFSVYQRWEHLIIIVCILALLLTGLPQKYRTSAWSQQLLSTPDQVFMVRNIHHIAAILLTLLVIVHIGNAIYLISRRRLTGDMLPSLQDLRDAFLMGQFLLFLTKRKPKFGKYNFEQKFTYWFLFFSIVIMVVTGFILWFPILFTRVLPGGIIPAAKLAHSTEAVVTLIFIVIWHVYHVHIERLNLSIFTGWINEEDMREFHPLEYERLTGESAQAHQPGEDR